MYYTKFSTIYETNIPYKNKLKINLIQGNVHLWTPAKTSIITNIL